MPVCRDYASKLPVCLLQQALHHRVPHSLGAPRTIQGGFAHTSPQSGLTRSLQGRPMPRVTSWGSLLPSPLSALSSHLEPGAGSPTGTGSPQPIAVAGAIRCHRHSHRRGSRGSRRLRRSSDGPCGLHSSGCLADSTSDSPNGQGLAHSGRLNPSHTPASVHSVRASTSNKYKSHQRNQASKAAKSAANQTAHSENANAQDAGDGTVGCSSAKAARNAAVKRQRVLQPRTHWRSPPDEDVLQLQPRIVSASVSCAIALHFAFINFFHSFRLFLSVFFLTLDSLSASKQSVSHYNHTVDCALFCVCFVDSTPSSLLVRRSCEGVGA